MGKIYLLIANCALMFLSLGAWGQCGTISTVAGNGTFLGDGGPATGAALYQPHGIAVDGSGNLYIADQQNNRIRKVSSSGIISTVAGNGMIGYSGDGGAATAATLYRPAGIAIDGGGTLYIADTYNFRIRKVSPSGIISTIAGNGTASYSGDGGMAIAASLYVPSSVAVDGSGNLYIADEYNHRIRKVSPSGIISTVAGNGTAGFSGDGSAATEAALYYPDGVTVDGSGKLYIADRVNHRIRKVSPSGIISTVVGNGSNGYSGEGVVATASALTDPISISIDGIGNIFIVAADQWSSRIQKVSPSGIISTIAGTGIAGYSSDGGSATQAALDEPGGVAVDASGNIYISDQSNFRIRKIATSGIISTVAGGYNGDGGPATAANLYQPNDITIDGSGNIYLADVDNGRIRKISTSGVISTVAGNGSSGYYGDGGPATGAGVSPAAVTMDAGGNLYIADAYNACIRKVNAYGIISTVAGVGTPGFIGDDGPATAAYLDEPYGIALDGVGNLYIADGGNARIRKVSPSGIISTIAGNGIGGYSGDSGPATAAALYAPFGVKVDASGNLYIADNGNNRIRKVSPSGIISTVAGNGGLGYFGDGGPATAATLSNPTNIYIDGSGNLYITEQSNSRIRKVNPSGTISTLAGNGNFDYSGDGGPATAAALFFPRGVTIDGNGNLFIADGFNHRIRKVDGTPPSVSPISGAATVCVGSAITLTDTTTGGSWISSATTTATVSSAGIVTGHAAGTAIISYVVANNCGTTVVTKSITVNTLPVVGTISGAATVCAGATITLTDTTAAGVWYSTNPAIASVTSMGLVSGTAAGTVNISYTVSNSCGSVAATKSIVVNPLPVAGNISGPATVCSGATISLTDTSTGGTWSSSNGLVASVNSSGVTSGNIAGTTTITYSVTNSCGSATAIKNVTVNPLPVSGSISGPAMVCAGAAISLADTTGGGVWGSSNTAVASVNSAGIVGGASAGSVNISYTVTNACGSTSASKSIIVNPLPVAGSISGADTVCMSSATTLTDVAAGGTWSSSPIAIATVNSSGIVGGAAAGSAAISYSVTNSCGSAMAIKNIAVNSVPVVASINGVATVCASAIISLTNATTGGAWSSSDAAVATINSAGIVGGAAAGTVTIAYTVANSCGSTAATKSITVNPLPVAGSISGLADLCPGATTALYSTAPGGVWSITPAAVATITPGGMARGVAAGSATVSYVVSNMCGTNTTTYPINVIYPVAGTISGPASVCAGATVSLACTSAGGVWSSSATAIASVVAGTGVVGGAAPGTATIHYTVTNICGSAFATRTITVNPAVSPSVSFTLTPGDTICAGTAVTFTATGVNGGLSPVFTWTNFGSPVGSGNPFVYTPGINDNIAVVLTSSAPCAIPAATTAAGTSFVVYPLLTPEVDIESSVPGNVISYLGQLVTFFANVTYGGADPTYQWYFNGALVSGATSSSYTAYVESPDTVFCVMASSLECVTTTTDTSNVAIITIGTLGINGTSATGSITISPNPNNGTFTVSGPAAGNSPVELYVTDMLGKTMFTTIAYPANGMFRHQLQVGNTPPGNYLLRIVQDNGVQAILFTIGN